MNENFNFKKGMLLVMEYADIEVIVGKYRYVFNKELDDLDKFVLKFVEILNSLNIKYAIVSGYVAILFGRSRLSEDIDIIVEKLDFERFKNLWDLAMNDFWCIITSKPENAYQNYLLSDTAIRFALKNSVIPNIEMKFAKNNIENWVLEHALSVKVDGKEMRISNIEMQIAFKLYLGSEKDIEDAKYLYEFFKEALSEEELTKFIRMFNVEDLARRYLKWKK